MYMGRIGSVILLGLALAAFCWGQATPQVAQGRVVSEKGVPLQGVEVYGTKDTCCPAAVKSTTTKADGSFSLRNAGAVLHFRQNGLEPFSVAAREKMPIKVVLKDQGPTLWAIPICGPERQSRFGWTFQFQRPAGKPLAEGHDVDYTRFALKGKDGGWLDAWFGETAGSVDPEEKLYLESKSFSERFVNVPSFGIVGIDTRGVSTNGRHWRWVGLNYAPGTDGKTLLGRHPSWHWPLLMATHMIRYENATESEASEFDKIVDSVCLGDK